MLTELPAMPFFSASILSRATQLYLQPMWAGRVEMLEILKWNVEARAMHVYKDLSLMEVIREIRTFKGGV
jgi:hypothetical protein